LFSYVPYRYLHLFRFLHHSSFNSSNQPAYPPLYPLNLFPHSFPSTAPTHSTISPISERFKVGFLFVTVSLAFCSHTRYHTHGLTPAYTQLAHQTYIRLPVLAAGPVFLSHWEKKKKRRDRQWFEQVKKKRKKKFGYRNRLGKVAFSPPGLISSTNSIKNLVRRCHFLQLDCSAFSSPPASLNYRRHDTPQSRVVASTIDLLLPYSYSFVHLLSKSRKGIVNYGVGHPHPSIHPPNSSTHTRTNILSIPTSALPLHLSTLFLPH